MPDLPQTTAEAGDSSVATVSSTQEAPATLIDQLTALAAGTTPTPEPTPEPAGEPPGEPDPDAPPEGTGEKQLSRWGELRQSRDEWKTRAESAETTAREYERFEPFKGEVGSFLTLAETSAPTPAVEGQQFASLVHGLNPALYEAVARQMVAMHAEQLGYAPSNRASPHVAEPPAPTAPASPPAAAGFQSSPAGYEFTEQQLEDLAVYGPEYVQKAQALMAQARSATEAAGLVAKLQAQVDQIQARDEQLQLEAANGRHDAQFSEEISNQLVALGIPRFTTDAKGQQAWNPEFVAMWKYFDTAFDADKNAAAARELSRKAFRENQRAAQPGLSAAVRSHIGTVIGRDIAPLLAPRQAQQLAATEAARQAATAPPVIEPGGAAPPATGQVGKLSLVEQIAAIKAGKTG